MNRHRPQFMQAQYEVRVPTGTPPGMQLLRVQATDLDHGKGLVYTIHGGSSLFQLEPNSGTLITVADLGPGPVQHTLTVMVSVGCTLTASTIPAAPAVLGLSPCCLRHCALGRCFGTETGLG